MQGNVIQTKLFVSILSKQEILAAHQHDLQNLVYRATMILYKSAAETIRLKVVRILFVKRKQNKRMYIGHQSNIHFCLRKQNKNLLYQRKLTESISITNGCFSRKFTVRKLLQNSFLQVIEVLFYY